MYKTLLALAWLAASAFAADIDGKWLAERTMERDGQSFTVKRTFDLTSNGANLNGTTSLWFRETEGRPVRIADGKIDGNKFSFSVTYSTTEGELKVTYSGTVEGGTLKGTTTREGAEPLPFEGKKL